MDRPPARRAPALLAFLLLAAPLAHAGADPLAAAEAARDAALRAEAPRLAVATWIKAEERLGGAAQRLQKGDAQAAAKRADEARALYAEAELAAIKASLLTAAREQVLALGPAGTARLAPRTTAQAQELLRAAEATLDADRTQAARASDLAAQAVTAAQRAQALAHELRAADERGARAEDRALEWEAALGRAAAAAGLGPLPPGTDAAGEALVAGVAALKGRADGLAEDLRQRDLQVAALEEELRDLDARLAGASSEARSLTERLEAGEHARAQYDQLVAAFAPDQAVVLRQGDAIVVRLLGLAFTPGTARLAPSAGPLLQRLASALALYPGALFTVEGHTDGSGDSAANQRLSQARAEALREYLVKQLQAAPGRVSAVGYGDSRPLASNASPEGRRLNRRIDLVITAAGATS